MAKDSKRGDLSPFQLRILRRLVRLVPGTEHGRWCSGHGLVAARRLVEKRLAIRVAPCRFARTEAGDALLAALAEEKP